MIVNEPTDEQYFLKIIGYECTCLAHRSYSLLDPPPFTDIFSFKKMGATRHIFSFVAEYHLHPVIFLNQLFVHSFADFNTFFTLLLQIAGANLVSEMKEMKENNSDVQSLVG